MSRDMQISDVGLKMIKAYEGFRPVDRELVTGQRVVGYGHRLYTDEAVMVDEAKAETLLKTDLAPFIDMLNENVHAPLSQSQFDALCSLAFNIGPKAFLQSDTLRALNNGRPLDAANGFDIWRKSEIDGKTYVVDALMRRRTAEKALFLRTENGKTLSAPRVDLSPVEDKAAALITTEDALPVFSQEDANKLVSTAPYSTFVPSEALKRRREDQGDMALSEIADEIDEIEEPLELTDELIDASHETELAPELDYDPASGDAPETARASTLIAKAASELSEKLDALIDDTSKTDASGPQTDWPQSLITADSDIDDVEIDLDLESEPLTKPSRSADILPFEKEGVTPPVFLRDDPDPKLEEQVDLIIDNLAEDDVIRESRDSASKYIEISEPEVEVEKAEGGMAYWLTLLTGFALLGASAAAILRLPDSSLQGWAPLLSFAGVIIGAMMVIATLFYALRASLRRG